jgi:methanogenic corrinoid protein MtbC1
VLGEESVQDLIRRLTHPGSGIEAYIRDLVAQGLSAEQVCLELFAPAARRMGVMWEKDSCSFVDVTLGVARLQQLTHGLGDLLRGHVEPGSMGRALVGTVPGEQHTLGITMVAEFLRRDGWEVVLAPSGEDPSNFVRLASNDWFDVVAVSAANDRAEQPLRRLLGALRRQGRNRDLKAIIGGRLALEQDRLVATVGADGWAPDARSAANLAASIG